MITADFLVIFVYVIGLFVVGGIYGGKVKNSGDLFAAGGQSPWWVSGLSGFMTMFSAGTFVVWGSIAFKYGFVAVSINMCYGIAALLVGWFVAGRWKKSGIKTPAEFIRVRFGPGAVHCYTWVMMIYRLVGTGVALYSLAIVLCALIPLPEGIFLRDAATGNLSLTWAIIIFSAIVITYTVSGGLWAVLMTDVIQFVVLYIAIGFVIPLTFQDAGGIRGFLEKLPAENFALVNSEFTLLFLAGWAAIHFFMVGAEWAFVQRFLCVPTPRDAKKSAFLFGALYLVSPLFWMLPPLVYRVVNPDANPEQAYILAAWAVLPAGMLGLMVAAMFSATASMVSSQLNVFAGVLTNDIIKPLMRSVPDERQLVRIGRSMTLVLGAITTALAVAVPFMGGAEKIVLGMTSLLVGPLLLPVIWALFSRRVTTIDLGIATGLSFVTGALLKFGLPPGSTLSTLPVFSAVADYAHANPRDVEILIGVVLPMSVLAFAEWQRKTIAAGATAFASLREANARLVAATPIATATADVHQPARLVSWCLITCGLGMGLLGVFNQEDRSLLIICAGILILLSIPGWCLRSRADRSVN